LIKRISGLSFLMQGQGACRFPSKKKANGISGETNPNLFKGPGPGVKVEHGHSMVVGQCSLNHRAQREGQGLSKQACKDDIDMVGEVRFQLAMIQKCCTVLCCWFSGVLFTAGRFGVLAGHALSVPIPKAVSTWTTGMQHQSCFKISELSKKKNFCSSVP
jgi:hypothetical protein